MVHYSKWAHGTVSQGPWWIFGHVEARALHRPHIRHTTIPGLRLEMSPYPIFGPRPWASCPLTIPLLFSCFTSILSFLSHYDLVPLPQYYMIDSCMSPPEWTHDPSGAQSSRSRPYKAPSYKSKHDTPSPLFMLISFVLSHSLSLMDDVSHLLTVLATLPGAW